MVMAIGLAVPEVTDIALNLNACRCQQSHSRGAAFLSLVGLPGGLTISFAKYFISSIIKKADLIIMGLK